MITGELKDKAEEWLTGLDKEYRNPKGLYLSDKQCKELSKLIFELLGK